MSRDHWQRELNGEQPTLEPSAPDPQRTGRFSNLGWAWEIISCVTSLVLLGAIVAIFYFMDNRPISSWHFPISINAVTSILTTACTAAMMHNVSAFISQLKWLYFKVGPQQLYNLTRFDEASRGPYGSAIFLFKVRWNLATVGALITICRLAFAPLAQQVVSLQPRNITTLDNSATFGFAHRYDRNETRGIYSSTPAPDPQMQAAILKGLYNISTPPQFNCSGSCLWDTKYISLGFKTVCKNVTLATLKTEVCKNANGSLGIEQVCNMTTPAGVGLSIHHSGSDWHRTAFQINTTTAEQDREVDDSGEPIKQGFQGDVVNLAVYRATADPTFDVRDINVTDCVLSFAAYDYSKAKANGSTFSFESIQEINIGDRPWTRQDDEFPDRITSKKSTVKGLPRLVISEYDRTGLIVLFNSATFKSEWVEGYYDNQNAGLSAALAGAVDLPRAFEDMSASMTDYLRSGPNMLLARGERIDAEIFVSIRWAWLIGPIALELVSVLFAIFTILSNARKQNVPLWKSSALVLLACQHEHDSGFIYSKVRDIRQVEKMAKDSQARLV